MRGGGSPEPGVIIIRNSGKVGIRVFTLGVPIDSGKQIVRVGSVSPVPPGVSQVFPRRESPPPLPDAIEAIWEDSQGGNYSRRLPLVDILRESQGGPREALIIDITGPGSATVYLEAMP